MKKKIKLILVLGTRPEIIKLAPVIKACENHEALKTVVVSTTQHREMLDPLLRLFDVSPRYNLNLIKENQSLTHIATKCLEGLDKIFRAEKPDLVLVQGDTTTAFAGALSAFYNKIKVGHVEAGLRSFDRDNPFPEEINRQLISGISDLNFAPTEESAENLRREGVGGDGIFVVGNTVVDALLWVSRLDRNSLSRHLDLKIFKEKKVILVTTHRRENADKPLKEVCLALRRLVEDFPDVAVVYPVHLNPNVRQIVMPALNGHTDIHLLDPLPYDSFVEAMSKCAMIITDSGGIQEEAPSFKKPVLVIRRKTERFEGVRAGCARVIGTQYKNIVKEASRLLNDPEVYEAMTRKRNPYGDGKASSRILQSILYHFRIAERPEEFVPAQ